MAAVTAELDLNLYLSRSAARTMLASELFQLTETHDELASGVTEIADGATDTTLPLGGVGSGETVLILSDQTISVKVNGAAAGLACRSLLLTEAAVTSLTASNSSGETATVRTYILGT